MTASTCHRCHLPKHYLASTLDTRHAWMNDERDCNQRNTLVTVGPIALRRRRPMLQGLDIGADLGATCSAIRQHVLQLTRLIYMGLFELPGRKFDLVPRVKPTWTFDAKGQLCGVWTSGLQHGPDDQSRFLSLALAWLANQTRMRWALASSFALTWVRGCCRLADEPRIA